jgi:phosphotransacetylase
MPLSSFAELHEIASRQPTPLTVAVIGADDPTVIEAVRLARDGGWARFILAGREDSIRTVAAKSAVSLDGIEIINSDVSASAAVEAARTGRAHLLMKGRIATPALMSALLHSESGLRTGSVICQVVLMELRSGRRFLLADTGICIQPTLEQKAGILKSAVEVARRLGSNRPRVALMAATEFVNDAMPETLDAAAIVQRSQTGEFGDCEVQGPLSFDLAFAADAGDKKSITGPVVGAADVLLFPNLLSANLTVKAIMYTADCQFGGVLCSAKCPVVFMSRSDSTATRLNSLSLALKLVKN